MTAALEGGEGSAARPGRNLLPGKDPVPILQEAGWAPGPVWAGAENFVPTGIRSRTLQPVVSRYTDWATGPTSEAYYSFEIKGRHLYKTNHIHSYYDIWNSKFIIIFFSVNKISTLHLRQWFQPLYINKWKEIMPQPECHSNDRRISGSGYLSCTINAFC